MTGTATSTNDDLKAFLGQCIDDATREHFHESAKKAPFFIRLMAETLHSDEARMRTILGDLGPDGLEAAKLALDYMDIHGKMMAVAEGMKSAAGRIVMTLEQMEADGDIVTTDEILEPLKAFYTAMERARTDAAETAATKKPDDAA